MSHQFKAGDMALIVNAFAVPSNIGRSVELVELIKPSARSTETIGSGKPVFNPERYSVWLVSGDGITASNGLPGFTVAQEKYLMPLRGDFAPERQKSQELPA